MRTLFAILGAAALAWGGYLAIEFAWGHTKDTVQALAWFVGGPVVHDAVVAPIVGLTGYLLSRRLPPAWRTPVIAGAATTGALVAVAIPLLWRPFGVADNPGLHDRDYWTALGLSLVAVWVVVIAVGLTRRRTTPSS